MLNGKHTYVCVRDRRVARAGWGTGSWTCPVCGRPMEHLGYRWRAPKRSDDRAWRLIERGQWLWDERAVRRSLFRPEIPKWIPWFERAVRDSRGRPARHRPRRGGEDR